MLAPLGPLIWDTNLRRVWRINRLAFLAWLSDGRWVLVFSLRLLTGFIAVNRRLLFEPEAECSDEVA